MDNIFSKYYEYKYGKWVSGDYIKSITFLTQNQDHLVVAIPRAHGKTTLLLGYLSWMVYKLKQDERVSVSFNINSSDFFRSQQIYKEQSKVKEEPLGANPFTGSKKVKDIITEMYVEHIQDMFKFFGFNFLIGDDPNYWTIYIGTSENKYAMKVTFGLPNRIFDVVLIDDMDCVSYYRRMAPKTLALGTPQKKSDLFDRADLKLPALNSEDEVLFPELEDEKFLHLLEGFLRRDGFQREYMLKVI
jgi:hypothetical protein